MQIDRAVDLMSAVRNFRYRVLRVTEIGVETTCSGFSFKIHIAGDHYDDAVMTQLLDYEWSLHEAYPEFRLTFEYVPAPGWVVEAGSYERAKEGLPKD